jgi:hypothetical protein
MLSLSELKYTNPAYNANARLWDYLSRSAAGGVEYRNGGYLRKYLGEDQAPGNQYVLRLLSTALDNHVAGVISIYRSQLFRVTPERKLGLAGEYYDADDFIEDCDLDETDLNDFMRDANDTLMTYGSVWICVDKPAYRAVTRAEEQAMGIRPYVTQYNPMQVMDWTYERQPNGRSDLVYVKIREATMDTYDIIRVWTPDVVYEYHAERTAYATVTVANQDIGTLSTNSILVDYGRILKTMEYINPLGRVPVFCATQGKTKERGIGTTPEIETVADLQRVIYNLCSELEQSIRINSHPSLVKTEDTLAAAGAGSIINMPSNLPGDLKPFLLQPSASTVDSILAAINYHVSAIDNLTNLTSVRGAKTMSGIAMETEQQTLNAKLNNMSAALERMEVKIWKLFFAWNQVEMPEDFEITYMKEFSIRDKDREIDRLIKTMAVVSNPLYQIEAQKELVGLTLDNDEVIETIQQSMYITTDPDGASRGAMTPGETHASAGEEEEQYVPHVEQMIRDGYSDAEILAMHPEVDVDVVDELRHQIES